MIAALDSIPLRPSRLGEPTWEILDRYPRQGDWSVDEYLALPAEGALVEFNDGTLEVIPLPDWLHQEVALLIAIFLRSLQIDGRRGRVALPPLNLRTAERKYRHPDVMYLAPKSLRHFRRTHWEYADLVIEVVSNSNREHDYDKKRAEYAAAGVPEYWIIDPSADRVLVLTLQNGVYLEAKNQPLRSVVQSATLPEVVIDLAAFVAEALADPEVQA